MNNSNSTTSLTEILRTADPEDLDVLVDYITDSGEGRISLDSAHCERLAGAKAVGRYSHDERALIETELRHFGGNTVVNLVRGVRGLFGGGAANGVPYAEIVQDIADHLKVKVKKGASTEELEEGILTTLLTASFEKLSTDERENMLKDLDVPDAATMARRGATAITAALIAALLSRTVAYKASRLVAGATVQALLGRGLMFGATAALARPAALLVGPIGWAVTGAWALADMASPAYRVTMPCVVQIAYMRKKAQQSPAAIEHQPS